MQAALEAAGCEMKFVQASSLCLWILLKQNPQERREHSCAMLCLWWPSLPTLQRQTIRPIGLRWRTERNDVLACPRYPVLIVKKTISKLKTQRQSAKKAKADRRLLRAAKERGVIRSVKAWGGGEADLGRQKEVFLPTRRRRTQA
eukprot:s305_g12.t1